MGVAYNQTITASGGTGTVTLAVSNIQGANRRLDRSGQRHGKPGSQRHAHGRRDRDVHPHRHRCAGRNERPPITALRSIRPSLTPATLPADTDRRGLQPDDHRQRRHRHGHAGREQHPGRNRRIDRSRQRHGKPGRSAARPRPPGPRRSPSPPPIRCGATTSTNYSITVNAALSLAPATLPADTVGVAYNQTITASGGTGTLTLAVSNIQGAIAGLTVPASGTGSLVVTGTPTAAGTETFTAHRHRFAGRDHHRRITALR